jgi:excisionase family DNA binding protein
MSPYMTRVEAAAYARVSTRTLDRWLADPDVPLRKYGTSRAIRIRREELDAWLAGGAAQAA